LKEDNLDLTDNVTPFDALKTPGKKQKEPGENKIITRSQKKRNKRGSTLENCNAKRRKQE
jgi:hypothetical protein